MIYTLFSFMIAILVLTFVFYILGLLLFHSIIAKQLRKDIKETLLRHQENKYTKFELNTIKNICTEEIFPNYCFYCLNYNIWKDLEKKLEINELVCEINSTYFELKLGKLRKICQGILFVTDKDNFFLYQDVMINRNYATARFLSTFKINRIKEISYTIKPNLMKALKYCVPGKIELKLDNKDVLNFTMGCCLSAELIKQKLYKYNKPNNADFNNTELKLSIEKSQVIKIDELYNKKKINQKIYDELIKRAQNKPSDIMNSYKEELLNI